MFAKYRESIRQDLLASVVVFLVALPLCMGIAIASGVPPAMGLISGIVGGLVVGFIAGSPLQVSGPAAGLAVIVWELVQQHGLATLGVIVLLGGVIQLAAGALKFGVWFRAISPAVVYGMLAGIGVLIFASQFHVMVDDAPRGSGIVNLLSIPEAIAKGIRPTEDASHHWAAMIGMATIASIVLWARFKPKRLAFVPAPLIAVLVAVAFAAAIDAPVLYVNVPDSLLASTTLPTAESWRLILEPQILTAALAMAMVASAETLLCAGAVDRMQDFAKTDYNRELAAQGVGNIICGFLGALPMTGVIVRSSANVDAGARTRTSAIFHGVWLLALVVAFPAVLRLIPTAALAAILVYTGYKLVNVAKVKELALHGRASVGIYLATMIGIVSTDLLKGVILGFVLSLVRLLVRVTRFDVRVEQNAEKKRVDLFLKGPATFVAVPKLTSALDEVPKGFDVHVDLEGVTYIDHACLMAIRDWEQAHVRQGNTVVLEWERLNWLSDQARVQAKKTETLDVSPPPSGSAAA